VTRLLVELTLSVLGWLAVLALLAIVYMIGA